jgi:hypothetical protein
VRSVSCRRIGGETAELPIQSDLAEARGAGDLIVGDVVGFECAGVDVAQHEIGRAGGVGRRNAGELPIQSHRADEGSASELVVGDASDGQCHQASHGACARAADDAGDKAACEQALADARRTLRQ